MTQGTGHFSMRCQNCAVPSRTARDAEGRVDFRWCPSCGARTYWDASARDFTPWAPDALWRQRFTASRVLQALIEGIGRAHPAGRKGARREVLALAARWIGAEQVGRWMLWRARDCRAILAGASPLVEDLAQELVTGGPRLTLHALRAKRHPFPRLALQWYVWVDRWATWWARLWTLEPDPTTDDDAPETGVPR